MRSACVKAGTRRRDPAPDRGRRMADRAWISAAEARRRIGCGVTLLRRLIAARRLTARAMPIGPRMLVLASDVDQLVEDMTSPAERAG